MRQFFSVIRVAFICLLFVLVNYSYSLGATSYTITDLGTLGGGYGLGNGINNLGQVVGYSETANSEIHAFLYSNGQMIDLGTFGGSNSVAFDINDSGQVVGFADVASGDPQAFLYSNGQKINLGTLGASYSTGESINKSGQVVGYTEIATTKSTDAFLYSNGQMIDLNSLIPQASNIYASYAYSINDSGQIVGKDSNNHAFLYNNGQIITLDTGLSDITDSTPVSINNLGQVVGHYTKNGTTGAFLYSNGKFLDLGTISGYQYYTSANSINDLGQVVGYSLASTDDMGHAFLYSNGQIVDLNSLLQDSNWELNKACCINNLGQIAGVGTINGEYHAYLLTPQTVSQPLTVSLSSTSSSGQAPLTITFTPTVSGGTAPYSYAYNFGDGTSSTDTSPSHTYASAGNYTATLTVTDNSGATATATTAVSALRFNPIGFLYFPHIASDGNWESEIAIINSSGAQSIMGTLLAYDNNGNQVNSMDIDLPPHGRKEVTVGSAFNNAKSIGYAVYEANGNSILGYTKFYIPGKYRVAVPAVGDVNTGDIYVSHIASNADWWTGISLVNTTSSARTLTLTFSDGESKSISLAAKEHKAFTVSSLFNGQTPSGIGSAVISGGAGVIGLELFGSTDSSGENYLSGILLKDTTTNTMYYPHVVSDSNWWTGIVAYNPSTTTNLITIKPYTENGTSLSPQTMTLASRGKYIGTATSLNLPTGTAWFEIDATSPITGFELFGTTDGNQLAGYTGVNISGTEKIFPKIETDGWTGIAFVNLAADTAHITLTAYDDSGDQIAVQPMTLAGHAKTVSYAADLFSTGITGATYIEYTSDCNVVGFQLNGSSDNMMLDGLPGL